MKTKNFVFEAFRDSLLTDNQFDIAVSSWLETESVLKSSQWVNEHRGNVRVVSSTYNIEFNFWLDMLMSFIYIINNKGPKIQPCGTPD